MGLVAEDKTSEFSCFEPVLVASAVGDHADEEDQYFRSVLDSESEIEYEANTEFTYEEDNERSD